MAPSLSAPASPWLRPLRLVAVFSLALAGFAPAIGAQPVEAPAAEQEQQKEQEAPTFIRFDRDPTGGGTLQTNIVRYTDQNGVVVDLIGAVHVGDHAYFELLNERFKGYDSLLYEMVKPTELEGAGRAQGEQFEKPVGLGLIGTLQQAMKTVLELEFQLDSVDYAAENFVHADMDLQTFLRRQNEKGEGFLQIFIQQMLDDMLSPPDPNRQPPSLMELMDAMAAPDRARRLKLLFARELSNAEDMLDMFGEESVIVHERNEAAFEVLDERIEAGDRKLGVFYGAAHLPDMHDLLVERGFEVTGEPEWLTAWDMTLDDHGRAEMREKLRRSIIASANGQDATNVTPAAPSNPRTAQELEQVRSEVKALRQENQALRDQLRALQEQVETLREESPE